MKKIIFSFLRKILNLLPECFQKSIGKWYRCIYRLYSSFIFPKIMNSRKIKWQKELVGKPVLKVVFLTQLFWFARMYSMVKRECMRIWLLLMNSSNLKVILFLAVMIKKIIHGVLWMSLSQISFGLQTPII